MNTLETRSISTLALDEKEEANFATLLHPMYMHLILGFGIFGGGAAMKIFLTLNGLLPEGNGADWAGYWVSSAIGFAFLMGLVFVKPVALRVTMHYREKNALLSRR